MASLKFKIINSLLNFNLAIGKKLTFLMAKYEANDYAEKHENLDLRRIPGRIKSILLHDQTIIEARMSECRNCEHFNKTTTQCSICKCFMKVKTRVSIASCPLNPPKWEKEYDFIKGKKVGSIITG